MGLPDSFVKRIGHGSIPATLVARVARIDGLLFVKDFSNQASLNADQSAGSGTATFVSARSGTAVASNYSSTGLLSTITAANTPRWALGFWDENGWNARTGLLIERLLANRIVASSAFTDASFTKTGMTAADAIGAPADANRPTATCSTLTATAANATLTFAFTDATAGIYYASIFVRRKTGTGTINFRANTGNSYTNITANVSASSWTRVTVYSTSLTNPTFDLQIVTLGDELYVFQADLCKSGRVTTPIPTVNAARTRPAEVLSYVIAGNRNAAAESIFVKATTFTQFKNDNLAPYLLDSDTKQRNIYKNFSNNTLRFYPNATDSASNGSFDTTVMNAGQSFVFSAACRHGAYPFISVASNGVSNTDSQTDWIDPAWGTSFYVGSSNSGSNQFDGIIEAVCIYGKYLPKPDVNRVHSLISTSTRREFALVLLPYTNAQTLVGGTTGTPISNADYQWHARLFKAGPDRVLMYTSNGFDRDFDGTTPGPLGELFVSVYTPSTDTWTAKAKIYTSGTYILKEFTAHQLPNGTMRLMFSRVLWSERPNYVFEDQVYMDSTDGSTGLAFAAPAALTFPAGTIPNTWSRIFYGSADKSIWLMASGRTKLWQSTDQGLTWTRRTPGIYRGNYDTSECQFVNIDNTGRIIGVIRDNQGGVNSPPADPKAGTLLMQRSSDWGNTWESSPILTGIGAVSTASTNIKVCPRIIFAPGNPGRVIVETNDRGGGNQMALSTATIEDAWNNVWSTAYLPMAISSQGNGDICALDDLAQTYLAIEHRTIGTGVPYYTSDDRYVVRRDVWDWTAQ